MFAGVDSGEDGDVDLEGPEMDMLMKVTQSDLYKLAFNRDGWEYGFQQPHWSKVKKLADAIAKNLEFDSNWVKDEAKSARILTFYIPIALWLEQQVRTGKKVDPVTGEYASSLENAVCVGLSIPQGGGKTTISSCLETALLELDIKTGVVSYDDFYLTYEDQQKVAKENPDNRFLQGRGTAGTHDMELGAQTIDMMIKDEEINIPRYDKSAYKGKGDRAKPEDWMKMKGSLDLVIVEGWMLGFQPVDQSSEVIQKEPGMEKVNELLAEYSMWEQKFDAAILVTVEDSKIVFDWREQAEKVRRDAGEGAMT